MATLSKPTSYTNWSNGSPEAIAEPTAALKATGWQPGQPVPAPFLNWLFYTQDQWIQWFDQNMQSTVLATALETSMRLVGGGTWSFDTTSGTLSWTDTFNLAIPSIPDANNAVSAGSVTLAAGQVAYVTANIPFTTTGDVTQGSATVENLGYELGIVAGQSVAGTGIAAGTTVLSISGTSLELSQAATQSGTQASLTFAGQGALSVKAADSATFIPNPATVLVARSTGTACSVGVGCSEIWLRDQESRTLIAAGYVATATGTAGVALSPRTAVYLSSGTADGRTVGQVYPADSSVAQGATRSGYLGITHSAASAGGTAHIVQTGFVGGFLGLVAGATYYVDPANPGALTATKPTASGAYVVPVGVATSSSTLYVYVSPQSLNTTTFQGITVTGQSTFKPQNAGNALQVYNLGGSSVVASVTDTGAATAGSLTVNGTSTLTGNVSIGGTCTLGAGATINGGDVGMSGNLTVSHTVTGANVVSGSGFKQIVEMGSVYATGITTGTYIQTWRTVYDGNAGAWHNVGYFEVIPYSGSLLCIVVDLDKTVMVGSSFGVQIKARSAGTTFSERIVYQSGGLAYQGYGPINENAIILYFSKGQLPLYGEDMLSAFVSTMGGNTVAAHVSLVIEMGA